MTQRKTIRNRPHSRRIWMIFAAAVLCALAPVGVSRADEVNDAGVVRLIAGSILYHDVSDLWSGFRRESGVDANFEVVFNRPSFEIFNGTLMPNAGGTINSGGDTSKVYAGVVWEIESDLGPFFNVGLGAAVHDGELTTTQRDKKQLGSRVLFRIPIEIGYQFLDHHRVSTYFAHVSNAGLADKNNGLDVLGLRYGYRF